MITGTGFNNCTDVTVNFGNGYECIIDSCYDNDVPDNNNCPTEMGQHHSDCSTLTCTTRKIAQVHQVSNGGRHPQYGPGYVWSPKEITIQPGDMVDWIWNLQVASEDTGISVQQTDSSTSNDWNGIGFHSEKSANGRLQYTFDAPGTYYYSSLPVIGDELFMKGSVVVESATEDVTLALSVMMGDIAADQTTVQNPGPTIDFGNCTVEANDCAANPTSDFSFMFTFASCLTATVSEVSLAAPENITAAPLEGFDGGELTIVGSGFSDNLCQNEVTIGDNGRCTVTS